VRTCGNDMHDYCVVYYTKAEGAEKTLKTPFTTHGKHSSATSAVNVSAANDSARVPESGAWRPSSALE
jgi:hypothetical protein